MREIKFRAWEPMNKEMVYFDGFIPFNESQRYVMGALSADNQEKTYYTSMNFDAIRIMQYTGLHDKSWKEIYEEDIVQYKSQSFFDSLSNKPMETRTSIIRWLDDELMFALYQPETDKWTTNLTLNADDGQFEIVGNTYENPYFIK